MGSAHEIMALPPAHIARSPGPSELEAHSSDDKDEDELARLGKKQVLRVRDACSELILAGVSLSLSSGISHLCRC